MLEGFKSQHLSYSSVKLWNQCPREWWLKYKYQITSPSIPAFAFGTAIHQSIQRALLEGGVDDAVVDRFEDLLKTTAVSQGIQMGPASLYEQVNLGKSILGDHYIRQLLNNIKVSTEAQIERRVEFFVPGVDLPVIGYIDIIDDSGHPYDIKTSKYDWDEGRSEEEVQPDFYLTALDELGDTSHNGSFSHLILVKNQSAPTAYLMTTHREGYKKRVFDMVQQMWEGVKMQLWEPRIEHSGCRGCRVAAICKVKR